MIFAPSARKSPEGPCLFFGEERLDVAGAVSINLSGDDVKMTTSAEVSGDRLWTRDGATYDAVAVGRRSDR